MKAKDSFVKMWDAVFNFFGGVIFHLLVNPFSMFLFNLFAPKKAAQFVREFRGLDEFWRDFYTRNALKWPLVWSRYWVTLDNLDTCSIKKQVAYYWANRTNDAVLRAMSSNAQVALVRLHTDWIDSIDEQMNMTDKMFAEWMKCIVREEHKKHDYKGHWNRVYAPLSDHLKVGKRPFSQVMILAQTAVDEYYNSSSPLLNLLKDYIERFGLNKKQITEIAEYMCEHLYWHSLFDEEPLTDAGREHERLKKFEHFFNMLYERQINYEQRVFTRAQRKGKQTDEWQKFCADTHYICAAAQKEMDMEQYKVFHATGHSLYADAIMSFLCYPERKLHRLVFRYEPLDMFEKEDIKEFICKNAHLKTVFDEEKAKTQ